MKMCEKLTEYKKHLQAMQKFCTKMGAGDVSESTKAYYRHNVFVWKLAEEGLDLFFKKEDFEDEPATN